MQPATSARVFSCRVHKSAVVIAALSVVPACVPGQRVLHYAAITTEGFAEASLACDAVSTHELLVHHPDAIETNDSALSAHPTIAREVEYFGGIGLALAGFNEAFDIHYDTKTERQRIVSDAGRLVANIAMIGVEASAIQNNRELGPTCGL